MATMEEQDPVLRRNSASLAAAYPPRHASLIRDILLAEKLVEHSFLGDDLRDGQDDHEQRWNEPRCGAAEPGGPSNQQ